MSRRVSVVTSSAGVPLGEISQRLQRLPRPPRQLRAEPPHCPVLNQVLGHLQADALALDAELEKSLSDLIRDFLSIGKK